METPRLHLPKFQEHTLETSLVEWKQAFARAGRILGEALETSLVEWKLARFYADLQGKVYLGNFLSGMETSLSHMLQSTGTHLGNFLSGMETPKIPINAVIPGLPWKLP